MSRYKVYNDEISSSEMQAVSPARVQYEPLSTATNGASSMGAPVAQSAFSAAWKSLSVVSTALTVAAVVVAVVAVVYISYTDTMFFDIPRNAILFRSPGNAPVITGTDDATLSSNGTLAAKTGYFTTLFVDGMMVSVINGSTGLGGTVIGPSSTSLNKGVKWTSTNGIRIGEATYYVDDNGVFSNVTSVLASDGFYVNSVKRGDVFSLATDSPSNQGKFTMFAGSSSKEITVAPGISVAAGNVIEILNLSVLSGLSVSGLSQFGIVNANNLTVSGSSQFGALSASNIAVSGLGQFSSILASIVQAVTIDASIYLKNGIPVQEGNVTVVSGPKLSKLPVFVSASMLDASNITLVGTSSLSGIDTLQANQLSATQVTATRVDAVSIFQNGIQVGVGNVTSVGVITAAALPVFISSGTIGASTVLVNDSNSLYNINSLKAAQIILNGENVATTYLKKPNSTVNAGVIAVLSNATGQYELSPSNIVSYLNGTVDILSLNVQTTATVGGITVGNLQAPTGTVFDGTLLASLNGNPYLTKATSLRFFSNGTLTGVSSLYADDIFLFTNGQWVNLFILIQNISSPNSTVFGNMFGPTVSVDPNTLATYATSHNLAGTQVRAFPNGTMDQITTLYSQSLFASSLAPSSGDLNVRGVAQLSGSVTANLNITSPTGAIYIQGAQQNALVFRGETTLNTITMSASDSSAPSYSYFAFNGRTPSGGPPLNSAKATYTISSDLSSSLNTFEILYRLGVTSISLLRFEPSETSNLQLYRLQTLSVQTPVVTSTTGFSLSASGNITISTTTNNIVFNQSSLFNLNNIFASTVYASLVSSSGALNIAPVGDLSLQNVATLRGSATSDLNITSQTNAIYIQGVQENAVVFRGETTQNTITLSASNFNSPAYSSIGFNARTPSGGPPLNSAKATYTISSDLSSTLNTFEILYRLGVSSISLFRFEPSESANLQLYRAQTQSIQTPVITSLAALSLSSTGNITLNSGGGSIILNQTNLVNLGNLFATAFYAPLFSSTGALNIAPAGDLTLQNVANVMGSAISNINITSQTNAIYIQGAQQNSLVFRGETTQNTITMSASGTDAPDYSYIAFNGRTPSNGPPLNPSKASYTISSDLSDTLNTFEIFYRLGLTFISLMKYEPSESPNLQLYRLATQSAQTPVITSATGLAISATGNVSIASTTNNLNLNSLNLRGVATLETYNINATASNGNVIRINLFGLPRVEFNPSGLTLMNNAALTHEDSVFSVIVGGGSGQIQFNGATLNGILSVSANAIFAASISSGSGNSANLQGSLITLTPVSTQTVFRTKITADTEYRLQLDITNGIVWGAGGVAVPDVRLRRTGTATLKLDNNTGSAATLDISGGGISNVATITAASGVDLNISSSSGAIFIQGSQQNRFVFRGQTGENTITMTSSPVSAPGLAFIAFNTDQPNGDPPLNPSKATYTISSDISGALATFEIAYKSGVVDISLFKFEPSESGYLRLWQISTFQVQTPSIVSASGLSISSAAGNLTFSASTSNANFNAMDLRGTRSLETTTITNMVGTDLSISGSSGTVFFQGAQQSYFVFRGPTGRNTISLVSSPVSAPDASLIIFNGDQSNGSAPISSSKATYTISTDLAGTLNTFDISYKLGVSSYSLLRYEITEVDRLQLWKIATSSIDTQSILSSVGNIVINPTGSTDFSAKPLINMGSLSSSTASDNVFNLTGTANVFRISNGILSGAGASNIAIQSFAGVSVQGFMSISFNGFSTGSDQRYNTGKLRYRIYANQVSTSDEFVFESYDGTTNTPLMRYRPSSTTKVEFTTGIRTSFIDNASGDLSINSVGFILFNSRALNSVGSITMGSTTSTLGSPKLSIYFDGSIRYGFGVLAGVLTLEVPNAGDGVGIYSAGAQRLFVNNAGLSLSVPITTVSGDLTLNPVANIAISNKVVTGIGALTTPYSCVSVAVLSYTTAGTRSFTCNTAVGSATIPAGVMNRVGAIFTASSLYTITANFGASVSADIQLVFGTQAVTIFSIPQSSLLSLVAVSLEVKCIVNSGNTLSCTSTSVSSVSTYTTATVAATTAAITWSSTVAVGWQVVQTGTPTGTTTFTPQYLITTRM